MKPVAPLLVLAAMALALGPGALQEAAARPGGPERGGLRALADGGLSLDAAVARVEREYKARAVRAEERRRDGRVVYRIRLLSADGRVFDVTVDAASGAIE